jgi:hypothetical protein
MKTSSMTSSTTNSWMTHLFHQNLNKLRKGTFHQPCFLQFFV